MVLEMSSNQTPPPGGLPSTRVAVLMPVRNAAGTVRAAALSVLDGGYRNLELVVVDDGSEDGTWERLAGLARKDPRVTTARQPPRGLAAALNRGLAETNAPLIARMDADDLSDPNRLELQVRFMESSPNVGVVGTRIVMEPRPPPGSGMERYIAWQNRLLSHDLMYRERFVESPLAHATAMFRADVLRQTGGWSEGPWAEDVELWLRLFAASVRFGKLSDVLYTWRRTPQSASWTDPRYSPEMLRQCKIHYLKRGPLNGAREVELWGVGRSLQAWAGDLRNAGVPLVRVATLNPKTIGAEPVPSPSGQTVLASYTSFRVRERLRAVASKSGWTEGLDFLLVA